MAQARRRAELEFELALLSFLDDGYGLRVRAVRDALNRRRSGYACLSFDYQYEKPKAPRALATVLVVGHAFTQKFEVDLGDPEDIDRAVREAEDLALFIHTQLEAPGDDRPAVRRWDD